MTTTTTDWDIEQQEAMKHRDEVFDRIRHADMNESTLESAFGATFICIAFFVLPALFQLFQEI